MEELRASDLKMFDLYSLMVADRNQLHTTAERLALALHDIFLYADTIEEARDVIRELELTVYGKPLQ